MGINLFLLDNSPLLKRLNKHWTYVIWSFRMWLGVIIGCCVMSNLWHSPSQRYYCSLGIWFDLKNKWITKFWGVCCWTKVSLHQIKLNFKLMFSFTVIHWQIHKVVHFWMPVPVATESPLSWLQRVGEFLFTMSLTVSGRRRLAPMPHYICTPRGREGPTQLAMLFLKYR